MFNYIYIYIRNYCWVNGEKNLINAIGNFDDVTRSAKNQFKIKKEKRQIIIFFQNGFKERQFVKLES